LNHLSNRKTASKPQNRPHQTAPHNAVLNLSGL